MVDAAGGFASVGGPAVPSHLVASRFQYASVDDLLSSFAAYMKFGGRSASRAQFEANMDAKMRDDLFLSDLQPLLRSEIEYDNHEAWQTVHERIVSRIPGDPWKGAVPGSGSSNSTASS